MQAESKAYMWTIMDTEDEFHPQMLHCGVSDGQSRFSACQSLQSAVPKVKRDVLKK